jgi:predicted alpha-1,2-mannosidase
VFNPATGGIAPRDAHGAFLGDTPSSRGFGQEGFDEGNAEQYLWYVPQNLAGLVAAIGGPQAAADRLDRLSTQLNVGPDAPYLWMGNEPNFGVPWLYNYIGQPWKTQQLVDRVRRELFSPTPGGEPGNDDLGAMSSWYVWAALGLYPITPGTTILTVNTPLFDRVEIALPTGKSIRISAPGASNGQTYISGLAIDGQPSEATYLPTSVVRTGGDVSFSLSATPNVSWGTAESSVPPSFGAGSSA